MAKSKILSSAKLKAESEKLCRGEELIKQFETPFGTDKQIEYMQGCIKIMEADLKEEKDKEQIMWMRKMIIMDRGILENLYMVRLFGIRMDEPLDLEDFTQIEKNHG